ncbi:MAG: efflux RND transporter periplasmic adaptor subunit [Verrucomicrobiaceae bacterium]|nr:efflux RND transporter periplasmic adaptor subunit [Verrucomicrobiaceae bacterium]
MKRHFIPLILLASCGHQDAPNATSLSLPSVPVKVDAAKLQPYTATEEVVGTVRSKQRATVEAKISGRILDYTATPGSLVKKGDVLAALDAADIQARVDQAEAMLAQAKSDFDRQKQLMQGNATTRQEFDATNARLKVATATLSEAQTMLGYAKVTAPFDGVITRKLAEVGDLAMPGKPLLEIEAPESLRFEADLPEAIIDRVKLGDKLRVKLTTALDAVVSEISPVADPVSRTFRIKLDLPATNGLRTGQFGRVSVPLSATNVLTVPSASIIKRGQLELVFLVNGGKASLRLIKTGKVIGERVEIISGIEEEDQIILTNNVSDGQPVTVQP